MKMNHLVGVGFILATVLSGVHSILNADDSSSGTAAPIVTGAHLPVQKPRAPGADAGTVPGKTAAETPSPAAGAPNALAPEQLQPMLVAMGCEVTDLGSGQQQVHSSRNGWDLYCVISVSPDHTVLWFVESLGQVANPNSVPASVWTALLSANTSYGCTFSLNGAAAGPATLQLSHAIPNTNVTPLTMRKNIDLMSDLVMSNGPLWDQSKWPKADAQHCAGGKVTR